MKKLARAGRTFLFVLAGILACTGSGAAAVHPPNLLDVLQQPSPSACRFAVPVPEKTCPGASSAIVERQQFFWRHLVRSLCARPRPIAEFYVIDFSCDSVRIVIAGVTSEQKKMAQKIDLSVHESLTLAAYEQIANHVAQEIRRTYGADRTACPFSIAAMAPLCEPPEILQKYVRHCRIAVLLVKSLCAYPYPSAGMIRTSFRGDRLVIDISGGSFSRRMSIPVNGSREQLLLRVKQGTAAIRSVLDFLVPE